MKLVLVCLVLTLSVCCCSAQPIRIKYTIENDLVDEKFTYSLDMYVNSREKFSGIMHQAAAKDDNFSFTGTQYPQLGFFVNSINGLAGDFTTETFWALLMRYDDGGPDCLSPVGVSSLRVNSRDHVVFRYSKYDIFDDLSNCGNDRRNDRPRGNDGPR